MSTVLTDTSNGVLTITLNDLENRNTIGSELIDGVMDALDAAAADAGVRVVVLTNAGSVFCAGANLKQGGIQNGSGRTMVDMLNAIVDHPKPVVARINGHCVAGGMGIAAAADISVAIDTAKMGFTEVRIGVVPAMISVLCAPKMRPADARELFLRGNRFTASDAAQYGIINHAVPADLIDDTVADIVDDLKRGGPNALQVTKELLGRLPSLTTEEAFAWTGELSPKIFATEEAKAGMAAFVKKEPAPWVEDGD